MLMERCQTHDETAMNRIPLLFSALLVAASTSATAQTRSSPTTQQGAPVAGEMSKGASTGASGSSGASSPTLMQEREKGMSPEGASGTGTKGKSTGKIKQ